MFDHIAKYAHDDDKTKAIFEHFRNLLTAGAVLRGGLTRSDSFLRFLSGTSEAIMLPI